MEEVTAKIRVIEAILACPKKYPDKTPEERLAKLTERFPENDSVFTFADFTKQELKDQLKLLQEEKLKLMGSTTANEGNIEVEVNETRKRRWKELNTVLDINKKAKMSIREDGLPSVGYSYVSWEQVKHIFEVTQGPVVSSSTTHTITDEMLDALLNYLSLASICFGSITEGHEAKRVHFIAPVIIIVCASFGGNIQILAEEDIDGIRVHAHGHFEFVLKRGDKRVCIVEAKKDDILQGKTQSLVGCESLSDIENLDTVYGIATNYLEWCFLKNDADRVTEEILTVELENNKPTKRSLQRIANKICSILV